MRPSKTFSICLGPVALPHEDGYHVLQPSQVLTIRGVATKLQVADITFFQVVDNAGTAVFSAPAHMIVYCVEAQDRPEIGTLLALVDGKPKVKRPRKKVEADEIT